MLKPRRSAHPNPQIAHKIIDNNGTNTSRANLNPIEEANAYQARIERFGWTPEHVAEVAGVSPATVMQRQALLELIPDAQTLVAHGHLPIGHAAALAGLDNYRQIIALRVYRESKRILPLADFRAITCELRDEQDQAALFDLESYFVELAQRVSEETFRSGKKATPRVPTRSDLPPVPVQKRNTGEVLDAFIKSLLEASRTAEAAVVGTLYTCLVHGNFVTMPANPLCI